jgi:hypothetical protein
MNVARARFYLAVVLAWVVNGARGSVLAAVVWHWGTNFWGEMLALKPDAAYDRLAWSTLAACGAVGWAGAKTLSRDG